MISVLVAFTASSAAMICGPAPDLPPMIPMERYLSSIPSAL
jgi:hypothetical protein